MTPLPQNQDLAVINSPPPERKPLPHSGTPQVRSPTPDTAASCLMSNVKRDDPPLTTGRELCPPSYRYHTYHDTRSIYQALANATTYLRLENQ